MNKKNKKIILSIFIILIGFLISLYFNCDTLIKSGTEISEDLGNTLELDMIKVTDVHQYYNSDRPYEIYQKIKNQKDYSIVPDYKVNINIPEPKIEGNKILFRFSIVDEGIQKLNEETYFYRVYVIQKNEKAEYVFPDNSYQVYDKWSYRTLNWKDKSITKFIEYNEGFYFPKETLMSLGGDYYNIKQEKYENSKIYLSFEALEAGNWDIYVFVFDEKYYARGTDTELKDYNNYCVGYKTISVTYDGIEKSQKLTKDKLNPIFGFFFWWWGISGPLLGFLRWRKII